MYIRKIFVPLLLLSCLTHCSKTQPEVVLYTSLDQIFSEQIVKGFELKTGITVKAVYDTEAAKTTGLVNRLIAEKSNPQADVFWNSEVGRTIILKQKGILVPYKSPNAEDIPERFKDPDGYWTGFAARTRILIYNKNLLKSDQLPESIFDLTNPHFKGKVALANPLFGTTATHAAALFAYLGDQKAKNYFEQLKANEVMIVPGNASSKDRVVAGDFIIGFTDTDDANVAIKKNEPVGNIYPDQDGIGTLLIPNTVAMIKDCPNKENAMKLIDYLLSKEVESMLAFSGSVQMPLRKDVKKPAHVPDYESIKVMEVSFEDIAKKMKISGEFLHKLYIE